MDNRITVYLIRHGKTYCNEQNLYYGKSDVDLCEAGIIELKEKKNKINYKNSDFYFTSGAKRANQTLELIFPQVSYKTLPKLFEYNFGDFELKSYNELKEIEDYVNWINDEEGLLKCPNGESKIDFKNRIKEGFLELIEYLNENKIKTAFGVTHGGTIGMILETMYNSKKKFYEWQPKNGEGYKLTTAIKENGDIVIENIEEIK